MAVPTELYRPSLALLTDLYEITMAAAAWKSGIAEEEAVFTISFRRNPFGGGFTVAAGLDPISSRRLDDLILELRDSLGATMVVVTHELPSIFAIADNAVFLDGETRTMIAVGNPKTLRDECPNPVVRTFLRRGETDSAAGGIAS